MGVEGDRICTVVKVLLNVSAFPSEEMKAHVNKPFHPMLTSHGKGQRKAVLKHQSGNTEREDLIIQSHLRQLDLCWHYGQPLGKINRLKN